MKAANTPTTDRLRRSHRGFNLIESMVGVAVLAIATTAIIIPISASRMQSQSSDEMVMAAGLARQIIEEIASKPLHDPLSPLSGAGPAPGDTTRAQFSNVDDYHGYTDSTTSLAALNGVPAVPGDGQGVYQRRVTVVYRESPNGTDASYGDFAMVTVTVTTPRGQSISLDRLFSSYVRQ